MLESIRDLTIARPHQRKTVQFTPEEFVAYNEGYYTGVLMALYAAGLAVDRYQLATRTRRADRAQKETA